jgi:DNA ligase 1
MIKPMLLHKENNAMSDDSHICELKLDGIRLILSNADGQLQCWTRHGTPCFNRFSELSRLHLPTDTILNGELIITDEKGHSDFEAVMKQFKTNPRKTDSMSIRTQ